jgi:hypothetical protein
MTKVLNTSDAISAHYALEQMGHGSFSDRNPSITESLMDFRNAPMRGVAQRANQSDHIQAKLAVR